MISNCSKFTWNSFQRFQKHVLKCQEVVGDHHLQPFIFAFFSKKTQVNHASSNVLFIFAQLSNKLSSESFYWLSDDNEDSIEESLLRPLELR